MKKFLTATDKKIEEFIAKHSDVVLSSSIHVLADEIGVSSSSISKYIKKISSDMHLKSLPSRKCTTHCKILRLPVRSQVRHYRHSLPWPF